ncbi:MAG: hypothetical protein AB1414_00880 [bacterium]
MTLLTKIIIVSLFIVRFFTLSFANDNPPSPFIPDNYRNIDQKKLEQDIATYEKMVANNKLDPEAHYKLGKLYILSALRMQSEIFTKKGETGLKELEKNETFQRIKVNAFKELETAVLLEPKNIDYLINFSELSFQFYEYAKAEKALKKALSIKPNNPYLHLQLGKVYVYRIDPTNNTIIEQGHWCNKALREFDKIIEKLQPKDWNILWEALCWRAMTYKGIPPIFDTQEDALDDFKQLIELQKDKPKEEKFVIPYLRSGEIYLKMNKRKEAEKIWKEGLKLFPQNKELQKKLESIKK